jgi:adenine-specific DNA-methyltransferase
VTAQYLRRVRVPRPSAISSEHASALAEAFDRGDRNAATAVVLGVYGMNGAALR